MNNQQLLNRVLEKFPSANHLRDIEFEDSAIRFTWAGKRFRVSDCLSVEQVRDKILESNDYCILIKALLQR